MFSVPRTATVPVVSQVIGNITRPIIPAAAQKSPKIPTKPTCNDSKSPYTLSKMIPKSALKLTYNVSSSMQVRFSHTDISTPDYSFYKRKGVQDVKVSQEATAPQRRMFTYVMVGGGAVAATYVAKTAVQDVMKWLDIPADVLAMAKLEVELGEIPEGQNMTVKWRGKPVFVRHRSPDEIEELRAVNLATLRDPQHDADRTQRPEWAVLIGVCTHLGCIPLAMQGDYNGYYCPCHGSHYDAAGRIRKGPAPLNLDIPEHNFLSDDLLVIG